jgi:acetyl-CoA synthetase
MADWDTYKYLRDCYDKSREWDELVSVGDRQQLNLGTEALGRHGDSTDTALRIRDFRTGESERYSFAELDSAANRVANYLTTHTDRAARIAAMLPARFELYATIFGTLKAGRVYVPLAPVFGPDAVRYRVEDAGASVLVTDREGVKTIQGTPPSIDRVLQVDGDDELRDIPVDTYASLEDHDDVFTAVDTHPNDPYALSYTSGTTGQPKGTVKRHRGPIESNAYGRFVTQLDPDDTYFIAAPPAWSYGLIRGSISPGIVGTAIGAYRGPFDPEMLLDTFETFGVTNTMIPPTALRQIKSDGVDPLDSDLDTLVTVGESLDAETADWCREFFGTRPLDGYGLTEAGMVICNYPFEDWTVKPGSMGRPVPGTEVALLDDDGNHIERGEPGEIAIRRGEQAYGQYYGKPAATFEKFTGKWLRTDDLARRDEDGYYWYVGRKDSVIVSAGYRIGPEEVEETLLKHDQVSEAVVVGVPDDVRGEIVKAYIEPPNGMTGDEDLADDIAAFARSELSKHQYPREIEFVEAFPRTSTGKIARKDLEEP